MSDIRSRLAGRTAFTAYTKIITNELERQNFTKTEIQNALNLNESNKSAISRIAFNDILNCWHQAESLTKDPLFAIRAACNVHPADFGPLGLLTTHCKTVGQAWQLAYKYQFIISDGFISELIIQDDRVLNRADCLGIDPNWCRPYIEHDFVSLLMILRYATANIRPDVRFTLQFRHSPSTDIAHYTRLFDANYEFNAQYDQIIFPKAVLDLPIYSANTDLFEFLSNKVISMFSASKHKTALSLDIASFIEEQLIMGRPLSLEVCSEFFNMSHSTLKRKLTEQETSYQEILDQTKLKIARKMLENDSIKMSQIAYTLGYSGTPQFTRFLKSHLGVSPAEYRKSRS